MNKDFKIGAAIGLAVGTGFVFGCHVMETVMLKDFNDRKELMLNGIVSAVAKARAENMTGDEFAEELKKELEFVQMTTRI